MVEFNISAGDGLDTLWISDMIFNTCWDVLESKQPPVTRYEHDRFDAVRLLSEFYLA